MINPLTDILNKTIVTPLSKAITEEIQKAQKKPFKWEVPMNWNQKPGKVQKRNETNIGQDKLRLFSVHYPVARACIDYLKDRVSELEWSIITKDQKDEESSRARIDTIVEFLSHPYGVGRRQRMKDLSKEVLEDALVLDAAVIYLEKTRGGELLSLIPVDPVTIKLRVDEQGRTPLPPEIAYQQIIRGKVVAEMTTEEMLFVRRKPRTNSPYGLAPLESLVLQVESALRGEKHNLNYLKEGNDPEGFYTLDQDFTPDQLKELQDNYDAMMAGGTPQRRRIKFMPKGTYVPVKSPNDMAFEKFELWMLQQTCAVFGVPPQEIGFTYNVNRSTSETQAGTSLVRGIKPLSSFLADIFNEVIGTELKQPDLKLQWQDLDPRDERLEAEINNIYLSSGVKSIDEVRQDEGMKPIGADQPTVQTRFGPTLVSDVFNPPTEQDQTDDNMVNEIRRWRKVVYNDLSNGKENLRKFESEMIDPDIYAEIESGLQYVKTKGQVYQLFKPFLSKEMIIKHKALKMAEELEDIRREVYKAANKT